MERYLPKHVDRAVADFLLDPSTGVRRTRPAPADKEWLEMEIPREDNHGNAADQT